jgi:Reverse transcriptase (RNA-dependent DNA polymerase)
VKRALQIDAETNTTFWRDALSKEMSRREPVIDILEEGAKAPVGYNKVPGHVIFDVKMDFTRKACFVAGGHVTAPPATVTYASVVSRESVQIGFLVATLNDLAIMCADVQGAYLNAPCGEKVYMICGPEFGTYEGQIGVIMKALYGLKTSGFAWRIHLAETLRELKCVSRTMMYGIERHSNPTMKSTMNMSWSTPMTSSPFLLNPSKSSHVLIS